MARSTRFTLVFVLAAALFAVAYLWRLRDSASAHQSTVNGPAGWEYKILVYKNELFPNSQVDFDKTAATNEKELNDWAAKGWELDRDHGVYLILRRPKR